MLPNEGLNCGHLYADAHIRSSITDLAIMAKQEAKNKQSVEEKEKQHEATNKSGKPAQKDEEQHSKSKAAKDEETSAKAKASKQDTDADAHADLDEGEELNALLEAFEGSDLTEIDLDDATGLIDEWYEILHKSKESELKEIGNSLKQLKKLLSNSKAKGEDIAEALSQMGEQTDAAANNAERGYKTKLHKLGKALGKAGSSIEKEIAKDEE